MIQPVQIVPHSCKAGISIVCAVKNRSDPLPFTLPTWLIQSRLRQLVIVDWDSDAPLVDTLAKLDIPGWPDPRVIIVRATDQPWWSLSKAINLGMLFVNQATTLKTDADILLLGDVQTDLPSPGKSFVAGDWRKVNGNQIHLSGTTLFGSHDFWNVGGYDERIDTYGREDDDLYIRFRELEGLRWRPLSQQKYFHLPHSDRKRMQHQKYGLTDCKQSTAINRKYNGSTEKWTNNHSRTRYEIVSIDETRHLFVVEEVSGRSVSLVASQRPVAQ